MKEKRVGDSSHKAVLGMTGEPAPCVGMEELLTPTSV